jgi:hypothetical protein
MTRAALVAVLVAITAGPAAHAGQQTSPAADAHAHKVLTPDALKWGPAPPALPPGAEAAILSGDPAVAGQPFTIRLKFPDGYAIAPHWHPVDEHVTVLQGTLMIGLGDKADPAALEAMGTGAFGFMPKTVRHFARAKGATLIQVNAIGPFEVNYVNASDDPRRKSGSN